MSDTLVRVTTHHFVAGLVVVGDRCTVAAPILRRACLGRTSDQLRALFAARGWKALICPVQPATASYAAREAREGE